MRPNILPVLVIAMGLSLPAYAGSDSSEVPNPFTAQPAASGSVTSTDKGIGEFGGTMPNPAAQPAQPGDFAAQAAGQSGTTPSPNDGFYEAAKKDSGK